MQSKFEWRQLTFGMEGKTSRVKVPGGWLIKHIETWVSYQPVVTLLFFPDPEHEWEVV